MLKRCIRIADWPLILAVSYILACVIVVEWSILSSGEVPMYYDNLIYFYPLSNLMGNFLRSAELPVWNQHQMSGMPLMADPQSGWGSVITMVLYTMLPWIVASVLAPAVHMAIASLGMLLFLRSTRVNLWGASLGALIYTFAGHRLTTYIDLAYNNLSYVGAYAWLPWSLLGVDLAVRHRDRRRVLGWLMCGLAASQASSAWLGQGAYYVGFATALYLVFLTLLNPATPSATLVLRVKELILHGVALTLFTVGLSAWTILPRLEFLLVSNLSGGYDIETQQFIGGKGLSFLWVYLDVNQAYVGSALLVLVPAVIMFRPTRLQVFYACVTVLAFVASLKWLVRAAETHSMVRALLDLIPGALELHLHYPERVSFLYLFFGSALAGTALQRLLTVRSRSRYVLPAAVVAIILITVALVGPAAVFGSPEYLVLLGGLSVTVSTLILTWNGWLPVRGAAMVLIALTSVELFYNSLQPVGTNPNRLVDRPETYNDHPDVQANIALLHSMPRQGRYLGYDAEFLGASEAGYRSNWYETRKLLTTTQATVYGLEDVQGYSPVHLQIYDRLMDVANGAPQTSYRSSYVTERGLESPLLDMLNARYVLTREGTNLGAKFERVAEREGYWLYENTQALPRTWIVHEVAAHDDDTALQAIDSGEVDARRVAVVSQPLQGLEPEVGPETLSVTEHKANEIEMVVSMSSTGLVVLSELDYPAWKVKVDGETQPVVRANGALRAVQVPEGTHDVTWYYSSTALKIGFVVAAVAVAIITALFFLWPRLIRWRSEPLTGKHS